MEEKKVNDKLSKIIDKSIDFVFSKDNRKWILLLVIIGFILRTLVAGRISFDADEMGHGTHAIGFISSGKLQIMDQDAIWFFLTDLFMKIFGVSIFGIRFASILFGSLTIILVYLLGKELFNEKVALIASIIFTFSPLQLIETRALMDTTMAFFALFSLYFLILFLKTEKKKFFFLTWISLGIAIMTKQIAVMFIPAFVLFLLYYNKKNHNSYRIRQLVYAAVIGIILISPILVHNYLLYKDKGILDLQFARFTRISLDTYESIASTIKPFSIGNLFFPHDSSPPGFISGLSMFYNAETLIVILLATFGLIFLFKQKNKFKWLFFLSFLFPFLFLSGTSLLSNHFVFGSAFIALLSSLAINKISDEIKKEKTRKILIYAIIILIIIFSLIKVNTKTNGFFGKNELEKVIDFKNKNIPQDSLVIADSRIYRGRIVFMFYNRHYLETNYFANLFQNNEMWPGNLIPTTTYYIEAVTDDSGWGTVSNQPEFNQTNEEIVKFFEQKAELMETIYDTKGEKHFNIYKTNLLLKPQALNFADSTHMWFFYPVGYKPKGSNFDDYNIYNPLDSLLDKLAHLILYLEILIALLLSVYIFFQLYKSS